METPPSDPGAALVRCSIARSLEVVGQKWCLLVVREALLGVTRFAEFRSRLGVAPDVLSARLSSLVEHGVLERRRYRAPGERERDEYVLTPAGRDLVPVLTAMLEWGDAHRPTGLPPVGATVDRTTGQPVRLAFVGADGAVLGRDAVQLVRRATASDPTGC
ncbi:DNA-binding transcriptional regulator, HxlR family [Friedmanniella luteola]|uniref:DNA-binding transcriptional regulator, HxlR family n=1 Tax=Friedmanniella luteola TaxID=546871 RepID=A0A1H1PH87_9ACTN|nr:helix-turn-helix domain-containing protein [Friedmanniella luteola]SDS10671.1 DNA-binding transcriptional regulator, HxlR family [Friedmanniella luteola]